MSKVFVSVGMSLDGFIAGPEGGPKNPLGTGGLKIHEWLFQTRAFNRAHGRDGGEDSADSALVAKLIQRVGTTIIGRRMFDEGEANWPETAPFRTPVFVLTHRLRAPWERPGGTTFFFTREPLTEVLARARKAAGGKDVRIGGGADVICQFLNAGLVDEVEIQIAPMLLGRGTRLMDRIDADRVQLELVESLHSPLVTHLKYNVRLSGK